MGALILEAQHWINVTIFQEEEQSFKVVMHQHLGTKLPSLEVMPFICNEGHQPAQYGFTVSTLQS